MGNKTYLLFFVFILTLATSTTLYANSEDLKVALSMQRAFIEVAKSLKESVVNISTERILNKASRPDEDDEAMDFFKKFFNVPDLYRNREEPKIQGAGSGLIISEDGVIVTNNHVIKGASKLIVKLHNGEKYEATVVGQDPQTDLAVIKIKANKSLKAASFANSDKIEVGQWAIAVGSPMGLEQTVTTGVISAVGRSGIGAATIEDFIQTDASINPGNSGGPLVDLEGRVMGINTLIYNAPGSGIGFSIPSNLVSRVANQILEKGEVERPYLGITLQAVTEELAKHYSLKNTDGAVVLDVKTGTPAHKAGIKAMDIVVEFNGQAIKSTSELQKAVIKAEVGKTVSAVVLRNGVKRNMRIKLEQMPRAFGLSPAEVAEISKSQGSGERGLLGISVSELTSEVASKLRIEQSEGVVISDIKRGSQADNSGLRVNDVITQINGEDVGSVEDFKGAVKGAAKKSSSVFLIYRDGQPMFVILDGKGGN